MASNVSWTRRPKRIIIIIKIKKRRTETSGE